MIKRIVGLLAAAAVLAVVNAPEDTTAAGIPADTAAVSGTADTLSAGR